MRREILMPTLSEEVDEGVVVTWFVVPGASVGEGDLVAEVQVEKVSEEVRAPAAGRLVEALVAQGDVVRQGAPIAVLEVGAPEEAPPAPSAPAPASPAARRLARELGVDLAAVGGSGPGGRVVEADVRAAAATPSRESPPAPSEPAPEAAPLSPMRRTIATRLTAGLREAAQLTLTAEADVTDLDALRRDAGASYTAAVVRACALALRDHPRVARRWGEAGLEPVTDMDVGVAVALDDGLVAPVIRAADTLDLGALTARIGELAERARAGSVTGPETQGAAMSVTSLGAHRIDAFTPLLDLPQAAILGVGRARPRPAVVDGAIVPRTLMVLSLTFDHRVVDGEPAAAFLDRITALLEDPAALT